MGGPGATPEAGGSDSMADDPNLRSNRANESLGRGARGNDGGDPLAELARLIGQNDPFADFGREGAQRDTREPAAASDWRADTYHDVRSAHSAYVNRERANAEQHDPDLDDARTYRDENAANYQERAHEHVQDGDETYDRHDPETERDEIYDDPPHAHRRGGRITIMAVLALAILGTAGAFGYRTLSGDSGPTTPPPVIKADTTPSKVVPPVQSGEHHSSKPHQDRIGSSQGERVVSREEQPVEMRVPQRSVFPPVNTPNSTASVPPGPVAAYVPPPASVSAAEIEPKKIRTVIIPQDQPDAGARPVSPAGPARSAAAASTTSEPGRPASARPATSGPGTAPLSLTPQNPTPDPTPDRRARTASVPNAAPTAAAGGSYVQVSSQRSESEAQASFKALQGKYPNVLGGRQAVIRRAELGDKGVYYRAMVGPFANVEQATELCSNLKAAGGQCVVQKN
jgi:hypothetical protein